MAYLKRATITIANLLWFLSSLPGYFRFRRALKRPEALQKAMLKEFLLNNKDTEAGRKYKFSDINEWKDFQKLPMTTGEDYRSAIERITKGHKGVLTGDPVKVLQPTSGTSSERKLIPFTKSAEKQFCAALDAWIVDLFLRYPRLFFGQQYWSISPATGGKGIESESCVPVGFLDDVEYFGSRRRGIMKRILTIPVEVSRIPQLEANQYVTGLFLLRSRDLRLMSVWHPSFLTLFLRSLRTQWDHCLEDLADGGVSSEIELSQDIRRRLVRRLPPMPGRAAELRALNCESDDLWSRVWPGLEVISCWCDGEADADVTELERVFPGTTIQEKSLLATEGVVSIPFGGSHVCAVTSHILEFEDEKGEIHGLWDLDAGHLYNVVLTTGAGLCRYQLKDRVEVTGFRGLTPCIRFLGRSGIVSDLVGEKLHIEHVEEIIEHLMNRFRLRRGFTMVVPSQCSGARRYVMLLEVSGGEDLDSNAIAVELESMLCQNYHYAYARKLGQLEHAVVIPVGHDVRECFREFKEGQGGIAATVKFPALCILPGIEHWLAELNSVVH